MKSFVSRFVLGFKAPLKGFKLISTNINLLRLSIIPFIISLALVILGLLFGYDLFFNLLSLVLPKSISMIASKMVSAGFLSWFISPTLKIIGFVFFAIIWVFVMLIFVNIICIPFHSLLAERALIDLNAFKQTPFSFFRWSRICIRMFLISITRTSIILFVCFLSFLISFIIPGFGFVTGFLGLIVLTFDCLDYSLEILEFGLVKRFSVLKKYFVEFSGFCCFFAVLPGLNLIFMPIAVVSAAWLIVELKINQEV